jgi:hypothetical protein
MKIRLDMNIWANVTYRLNSLIKRNSSIQEEMHEALNYINWEVIGLKYISIQPDISKHFDVIDKKKFFLAIIEHGIVWSEINY